jgi:hypothetical protein
VESSVSGAGRGQASRDLLAATVRLVGPRPLTFAVLAGAFFVIGVLLASLGTPTMVTWLDVGSPGDEEFIAGFFPRESNPNETFRWSESSATLTLPAPSEGVYEIDLALGSVAADTRTLALRCDDTGTQVELDRVSGLFHASMRCAATDDAIVVHLDTPDVRLPADGRPLGIAVRDARVLAIDRDDRLEFWGHVGLALAALVSGLAGAATAARRRGLPTIIAAATCAVLLIVMAVAPAALLPIVSGPGPLIALAGGLVVQRITEQRRSAAAVLVLAAALAVALASQPDLVLVAPARWVDGDADALRLLPWLAVSVVGLAVIIGGERARWMAALGAGIGALAAFGPLIARVGANRWAATIAVPDWTDAASVGGLLLLSCVASAVVAGVWAVHGRGARRFAGTVAIVAATLAILLPWRDAVMLLNGDEPHYYVTARSMAEDRDLELLDDYLEPDYLAETISPTGNISVGRDTATDRFRTWAPVLADGTLWRFSANPSMFDETPATVQIGEATDQPAFISDAAGQRDALPALEASERVVAVVPQSCRIEQLWIASTRARALDVEVVARDDLGAVIWAETVRRDTSGAVVIPDLAAEVCKRSPAVSITIESRAGPVVAQAIDRQFGLKIVPARPAAAAITLGGLPRDQFATLQAIAWVAVMNPGQDTATALVRTLGDDEQSLRVDRLTIEPGETAVTIAPIPAGAAVLIDADVPVVSGGLGALAGGSYALVEARPTTEWAIPVTADSVHDAGVWLTLVNPGGDEATVEIIDGTTERVRLDGMSAVQVLLVAGDTERIVTARGIGGGRVRMVAVDYEQQTGGLHFDLALPLLAALPAAMGGPGAALMVSVVADVLLAAGVFLLLRRETGNECLTAIWTVAFALLAPMSPFAVRLYTEVVAAAVIVWALVCWAWAGERRWLAGAQIALGLLLPFIHGRYSLLALILVGFGLLRVPWRDLVGSRWRAAIIAGVGIIGVGVLAAEFAVGLRERVSTSYVALEWLPHSLVGVALDRGSGILPFAPWLALALFAGRLSGLQRISLLLFATQLTVTLVRESGWQAWGPPGRYVLPVIPLLALLVAPVAARWWRVAAGRVAIVALLGWSASLTLLLHWVPLSGYVSADDYLIDAFADASGVWNPIALAPRIRPEQSSGVMGAVLLITVLAGVVIALRPWELVPGVTRTRTAVVKMPDSENIDV